MAWPTRLAGILLTFLLLHTVHPGQFSPFEFAHGSTPERCRLNRILERISARNRARTIMVAHPEPHHRLTSRQRQLLEPNLEVHDLDGESLRFRLAAPNYLPQVMADLATEGVWLVTTPTTTDGFLTGHSGVIVYGTYFDRGVDLPPEGSMRSIAVGATFLESSLSAFDYVVLQYFELGAAETQLLSRFFHERVWFHHSANPDYQSTYQPLPFTRDQGICRGESCVSFVFPWVSERWVQMYPGLTGVGQRAGNMLLTDIPMRQIYYNSRSAAYRGTILVTRDAEEARRQLLLDTFGNSTQGSQLLLRGPAREIP